MLNNDQALRAARQKRSIHKYVDDDTVTASFVVQTAAAIYFDIPAGKQVVVQTVNYGIETANKMVDMYIVGCDAVAGGGTVVVDLFHTGRESGQHTFRPGMKFNTGLYIETFTNLTSVVFGWEAE